MTIGEVKDVENGEVTGLEDLESRSSGKTT